MTGRWFLLAALVMTACSGGGGDEQTPTTSSTEVAADSPVSSPSIGDSLPTLDDVELPPWQPETRTEALLVALAEADGPTVQHAIDALGLLIEGVPGVTPSDLPVGETLGGASTWRLVNSVRDQLTGEQAAVADQFLEPGTFVGTVFDDGSIRLAEPSPATTPPEATTTTEGPSGFRRPPATPIPPDPRYVELLGEVKTDWKAHLPSAPKVEVIEMYFFESTAKSMDAHPEPTGTCVIRVPTAFVAANHTDDDIRFQFAHEVFHCFQFEWEGSSIAADWVLEGSAQWAAIDLYRARPINHKKWYRETWFTASYGQLHARTYSAWPLYEIARVDKADAYASIQAMVAAPAPDVTAQLAVGDLDGPLFRKSWSTRTLRSSTFDDTWRLAWPNQDSEAGPHDNAFSISRGTGKYDVVGPWGYAQRQIVVTMGPEVGFVSVTPMGVPLTTHTAIGTQTVGADATGRFCFSPDGCQCPGSSTSGTIPMLGRDMVFSYPVSQAPPRGKVVAEEWDADKECLEDPPPKTGESNGDPHLLTFDGLPYDVMTLGEFVTARDPTGDLEVQARHERFLSGAGTTAVALGTGTGRITVTMADFLTEEDPIVRVDGVVADDRELTVDGVRISVGDLEVRAVWPDGSVVHLRWYLGWFVTVSLPPERAGRMEGLLGAADGNLANDLKFPDGTIVDTTDAEPHESDYVLAWAVDDGTTLFDYEPGQSVATFRVPHPNPDPPPPDPEATSACESALGDQAAAHDVASCAFDVSVTGEAGFVEAYEFVVESRSSTSLGVPDTAPTAPPTTPGPGAESLVGVPTLTLDDDQPSGSVAAVEGTVLVVRANACAEGVIVDVIVSPVADSDRLARASLCDPSGVGGILARTGAEWFDGEAYIWIPGTGDYEVVLDSLNSSGQLGEVFVYADPAPTVLLGEAMSGGDERSLTGIADTVVYLPEAGAKFAAEGFETACAVEVYWGDEFPRAEPFELDSCEHAPGIDFPPTDMIIPVVVFNRTGDEIAIRLRPTG